MTGTCCKYRDRSHARIYAAWVDLPAWRTLSLPARCLLFEMLVRFRPGANGQLAWPARRVGEVLNVSKATGARALIELENAGWIEVETVARFGGHAKPAMYSLTMFPNDVTGDPPSSAFESISIGSAQELRRRKQAPQSHQRDKAGPPMRLHGLTRGTEQSHQRDTPALKPRTNGASDPLQNPKTMNEVEANR